MGTLNFTEQVHDSKTLPEALEQYERLTGRRAVEVSAARGFGGMAQYKGTRINVPKPDKTLQKRSSKSTVAGRPLSL